MFTINQTILLGYLAISTLLSATPFPQAANQTESSHNSKVVDSIISQIKISFTSQNGIVKAIIKPNPSADPIEIPILDPIEIPILDPIEIPILSPSSSLNGTSRVIETSSSFSEQDVPTTVATSSILDSEVSENTSEPKDNATVATSSILDSEVSENSSSFSEQDVPTTVATSSILDSEVSENTSEPKDNADPLVTPEPAFADIYAVPILVATITSTPIETAIVELAPSRHESEQPTSTLTDNEDNVISVPLEDQPTSTLTDNEDNVISVPLEDSTTTISNTPTITIDTAPVDTSSTEETIKETTPPAFTDPESPNSPNANIIMEQENPEIQKILILHNNARQKHGSEALTWSSSASAKAQEWADVLASECKLEHGNHLGFGQNLYMGQGDWESAVVGGWYDEVGMFDFDFGGFGAGTGHFTQVVWRGTTMVGCGVGVCEGGKMVFVCDYSPPGNIRGEYRENVGKIVFK